MTTFFRIIDPHSYLDRLAMTLQPGTLFFTLYPNNTEHHITGWIPGARGDTIEQIAEAADLLFTYQLQGDRTERRG